MIDLRVSFRAVRGLFAALVVAGLAGTLTGCTGETAPAPADSGASAPSSSPADSKKVEAKQAGKADKGNLMPQFPKG
ncbi:MAG: hypothetical protein U0794_22130 [Isosphaeraceae bacterium]